MVEANTETQSPEPAADKADAAKVEVDIFGPPLLIHGEDLETYATFRLGIVNSVRPRDFLQEILVEDVVADSWLIRRLRKMREAYWKEKLREQIERELRKTKEYSLKGHAVSELSRRWADGDPQAIQDVDKALAETGKTAASRIAFTFASELDHIARIDEMIDAASSRRDSLLRGIDRRQSAFVSQLARESQSAIDAVFDVTAPPTAMGNPG